MEPLKQPKTFDQQIDHLVTNHGLTVDNLTRAKGILVRVNYYRLSAYGIGLYRAEDRERFTDGITLEHIYHLYCFDCCLRNLLTPLIEMLEVELRTAIAYHLALTYGAEGYRDAANFISKTNKRGIQIHQETMERFDKEISSQKNLPCVKHHQTKYGGHFPAWAAVELFTFGMLSSLFSIMLPQDRKVIAKQFRTEPNHLQSWILALVEVRNICAHFGRIYNMPLAQSPYLYSENDMYRSNKIFPLLLTIKRMVKDHDCWSVFYQGLESLMVKHPEANLSFMGFPENWQALLYK